MPAIVPTEKDQLKATRYADELELLYRMLLIRRFEERASQSYQQQKIGGFCHLYIGQEAVAVELRPRPGMTITSSLPTATTVMPSPGERV